MSNGNTSNGNISNGNKQSVKVLACLAGVTLSLSLGAMPSPVLAHAGHDHEFTGGNAAQLMQPLTIDPPTATALGLKTTALTNQAMTIPAVSVVDAGDGNQLVYIQANGVYKPVPVKVGKITGDNAELAEGNLKSGDQIVTQGAPLLYSEALRRKPATAADHEHGPLTHGVSKKKLALGLTAGLITGAGIMFGLSKFRSPKPSES